MRPSQRLELISAQIPTCLPGAYENCGSDPFSRAIDDAHTQSSAPATPANGRLPSDTRKPYSASASTTNKPAKPMPEYQADSCSVIGKLSKIIRTYQVRIVAMSPNRIKTKR